MCKSHGADERNCLSELAAAPWGPCICCMLQRKGMSNLVSLTRGVKECQAQANSSCSQCQERTRRDFWVTQAAFITGSSVNVPVSCSKQPALPPFEGWDVVSFTEFLLVTNCIVGPVLVRKDGEHL